MDRSDLDGTQVWRRILEAIKALEELEPKGQLH